MPDFDPPSDGWTIADLRSTFDGWRVPYRVVGDMLRLDRCQKCGVTEGNPAAGIRDGVPFYKCFRANKCGATFADLRAMFDKPSRLLRICALDLPKQFPHPREPVIEGLLRRGDVAGIVGGPKSRKSWLMMQMMLSVAAGVPFLGWETVRGRVLLIDNELRGDDLSNRMTAQAKAMGLSWTEVAAMIDIIPLRGKLADLHVIRDELIREPRRYSLAIVDAIYKALPRGIDENSNSDMTSALVLLDEAAEKHDCGIAFAHHLSKGSQHQKSVTDLGSGAGAQSRSVDVHLAMTAHEAPNTVVLQGVLRSQKPFDPLCLEFVYPLWKVADDKDPAAVAVIGKKPVPSLDAFVATIPNEATPQKNVLESSRLALGTSMKAVLQLLGEAEHSGLVEVVKPTNRSHPYTVRRLPMKAAA